MPRGESKGNREAKKPKKEKVKQAAPVSTFAAVQKKPNQAPKPKSK